MRRGDYRELSIRRQMVPDGRGGEVEGLAIHLFVDDADEDPDDVLGWTMLVPDGDTAIPDVRTTIDAVLEVFELGRL
jgi:hypothetical protein